MDLRDQMILVGEVFEPNVKFTIVNCITLTVASILLIAAVYLLIKIYKIFQFRDAVMLLSLVAISLVLATMIVDLSIDIMRLTNEEFQKEWFTGNLRIV